MLVTLLFANGLKLANHNKTTDVQFISSLKLSGLSLKAGLASDIASIDLPKQAAAKLDELIYLTKNYSLQIYVYINNEFNLLLDGIVTQVVYRLNKDITLSIVSKASLYLKQPFLPKVENICQLQVYSEICGLNSEDYSLHFDAVKINTLTGTIPYTLTYNQLVLSEVSVDITAKPVFNRLKNIELAYIRLNKIYRSRILEITSTEIVLDLNYIDGTIITDLDLIISCDKTYGGCHTKFKNTKNFYGFSSIGKASKNYNIFTSEALTYCGDFTAPQKECNSDNYLLGVEL